MRVSSLRAKRKNVFVVSRASAYY